MTRREFARVIALINERGRVIREMGQQVERNARNLEVQFARMAQIQADLDLLKRALAKLNLRA